MVKMTSANSPYVAIIYSVILLHIISFVSADEASHEYEYGEKVVIYINKIGPYDEPSVFNGPDVENVCYNGEQDAPIRQFSGLGSVLHGDALRDTKFNVLFKVDTPKTEVCEQIVNMEGVHIYSRVLSNFYVEYIADGLPMFAFMGKANKHFDKRDKIHPITGMEANNEFTNYDFVEHVANHKKQIYYLHRHFHFEYKDKNIITATLNMEDPYELEFNITNFDRFKNYYSVTWAEKPDGDFRRRFERYLDHDFFQHHIHWFSLFNSFMMVIFLVGVVTMIMMRTLRKDFARYKDEEDLELLEEEVDESGWKIIHGDVFRPVQYLIPLSVCLGSGLQMVFVAFVVCLFAIFGTLWEGRGLVTECILFTWAFTSFLSGYISGGFYKRNDGKDWIKCMLWTGIGWPFFVFLMANYANLYALFYGNQAAIPFSTGILVMLIWAVISFPLVFAGSVVGRNWAGTADLPCRVKRIPSPIPEGKFYQDPPFLAVFSGLLPFGSIFIELYFIFTSFWSYKVYFVYGFLLLALLLLIIVSACICTISTYFLLSAENYLWQWTSFASGASTGLWVLMYSFYYFHIKTDMASLMQSTYYWCYSIIVAGTIALMSGSIGYVASSIFVRRIYRNVKCD